MIQKYNRQLKFVCCFAKIVQEINSFIKISNSKLDKISELLCEYWELVVPDTILANLL